jgi:FMN phosphatase YigB (HAD superfamily)
MSTVTQPVILYDYDDTLGGVKFPDGSVRPGADAYFDCIRRLGEYVDSIGLNGERVKALQHDIDLALAKIHGFGNKTRFAQSFKEAFNSLHAEFEARLSKPVGQLLVASEAEHCFDIGMSVFTDYPYAPLEGALDVLHHTTKYYRPVVITKGELSEQAKKLEQSGVASFLDDRDIFIVSRKDEADWNRVLDTLGLYDPDIRAQSWAVGNSAKADVNPLLRRGFNGIEIAGKNGWTFEKAEIEEPMPGLVAKTVTDIRDILDIIPLPQR